MLRSLVRPSNYRLRHSFHSTAVAARPSFPDTSPKETKTKRTKVDSLEGLVAEIATANAPTRVVRKRIKKIEAPVLPGERLVLPEQDLWRGLFPPIKNKDRISLSNPATAAAIAEAYVPAGSRDQVIIEAFPGPGALTRALLNLPKNRIRKLIIIEDHEGYLDWLRPLAEFDPRVEIVAKSGFAWEAYQHIEEAGMLDGIEALPWEAGPHPHLQFITHIPLLTMGEQFVAQTLRCIPEQTWLYKFGRVSAGFVLSEWVWSRVSAELSASTRCKLTIIAEATASCDTVLHPNKLTPYDLHFHPTVSKAVYPTSIPENRRIGAAFVAVHFTPLENQVIGKGMLDKWDYCLRRLFVMKSKPLKTAISHLAPGAGSLLKKIGDLSLPDSERFDITTPIRDMSVNDWATVVKAFDEWPFAPEDLMVHDGFIKDGRKTD